MGRGITQYNATYRISAGGEIKPQITSEYFAKDQDYANLGFPGKGSRVADIDWDELVRKSCQMEASVNNRMNFENCNSSIFYAKNGLTIGQNGKPVAVNGTGTLLVEGDLEIKGDLYYEDAEADEISDMDSMGV
ncbi:MAG TPA: hypothetical protein DEG92_01605, partial [Rikenellaceae bacterium]|nr:hypothetical protein [Rikenellaceae bacterium]